MNELIKAIIYLLVGVSILLCGMRLMSNGLKRSIGSGLKGYFRKTENNAAANMGVGVLVTAGIQSSDATNSMVIGFINAGAMSIYQGLCIMLGAYIGTTVTGIIASFSTLSFSTYFLLFSVVGTVLMFIKKDKVKNVGEILCGLGFLFFALAVMKDAFKNPDITLFCQNLFSNINYGFLLFIIGILITALVQSSSAITSIVIAMAGSGAINLSNALFIVLGATLGTVTNTLLSSVGGNIKGKRAALSIFLLRALAALIMMIILIIFINPISSLMHRFAINGSDELPIALFTVFYNVIFMPLLIPLLKPTTNLVSRMVKDKETDELSKSIHYIDDKLLNTPFIASMQVKKEIINMYDLASNNFIRSINLLINKDESFNNEIIKSEDKVDFLNGKITDFLIKLSQKVQDDSSTKVGSYFHVINDIERIGDHAYNFYEMYLDMKSKELTFSDVALTDINNYVDILKEMFVLTKDIFVNKNTSLLKQLKSLEDQTDKLSKEMATKHYNRITSNQCKNELTPFYSSLLIEFERIADHLTNIGYSIINPIGEEE